MTVLLQISELTKTFVAAKGEQSNRVLAVDGVTISVEEGQMYTLLGPSGCGKTTTLRSVAGLEQPTSGEIVVAGKTLFSSAKRVNLRADQRGLGMVFQSYAIWPHMNVFKNVAFPLQVSGRKKRVSRAETRERVMRVLKVVRLDHLATRPATDLSGGQQQRLALARAIVMEPALLLLDEPLSNLDAKLREEMRFELKRLQSELAITSIYVTHDQAEALAMSDVIAVMNGGKLEQVGSPREIYENPATAFVAEFIGTSNFFPGTVASKGAGGTYTITTDSAEFVVTSGKSFAVGQAVRVGIRPEYVEIQSASDATEGVNRIGGTVIAEAFAGESVTYLVRTSNGQEIYAKVNPMTGFETGDGVTVAIPTQHSYLVTDAVPSEAEQGEKAA